MIQQSLISILRNYENINWRLGLYLPRDKSGWSLNSLAIIEDPDNVDSDDPDEDPQVIKKIGYRYVLDIQSVKGIVKNAIAQKFNISDVELFDCFIYYLNNDAYMHL